MIQLDDDLAESYLSAQEYPKNIIDRGSNVYTSSLQAAKELLDDAQDLFVEDESLIDLTFRDLNPGSEPRKRNLHKDGQEQSWLGIETKVDEKRPGRTQVFTTKKDPKCRLVYVYSQHGRQKLKVFKSMLMNVLSYHQVMPAYLDFVMAFGLKDEPDDLRFSGFREQTTLSVPSVSSNAVQFGRSGCQFQLCYNLRTVAKKASISSNPDKQEWSIQQAAIHHQFDVVEGTSLWIMTKGGRDLYERFKDLTSVGAKRNSLSFATLAECFQSSLATHLMICHWSTEGWRWHLRWLERAVESETGMAEFEPIDDDFQARIYTAEDIMALHHRQDRISECVMALEANVDIMSLLKRYYSRLLAHVDFPLSLKSECAADISNLSDRIDDMLQNFKMELARAKLLIRIVKDRKELIVQHLQTQASGRMEKVSFRMEQEAVIMRIVTLVTLLYLPPTFVSTFFSTDIIKYQVQDSIVASGTFNASAMYRWLQVTLPLTLLTLLFAWWVHRQARKATLSYAYRNPFMVGTSTVSIARLSKRSPSSLV